MSIIMSEDGALYILPKRYAKYLRVLTFIVSFCRKNRQDIDSEIHRFVTLLPKEEQSIEKELQYFVHSCIDAGMSIGDWDIVLDDCISPFGDMGTREDAIKTLEQQFEYLSLYRRSMI